MELFETKLGQKGLNPLELIQLRNAVKEHKRIALINGKRFRIKYYENDLFYQRDGSFVPCGWINRTLLLRELTNE